MPDTTINPGPGYRLLRPPSGDDPGELVEKGDDVSFTGDNWEQSSNWCTSHRRQNRSFTYRRRIEQPEPEPEPEPEPFMVGDWVRLVELLNSEGHDGWFPVDSLEPADAPTESEPWRPSPGYCIERGGGKAWVAARIPDEFQRDGLVWLGMGSDREEVTWRDKGQYLLCDDSERDLIGPWVEPPAEPTDAEIAEAIRDRLAKREMIFYRRYVSNVRELVEAWRENGGGE